MQVQCVAGIMTSLIATIIQFQASPFVSDMLDGLDCLGMVVIVAYTTIGLYFLGEPPENATYDLFGSLALISALFVIAVGIFVFALETYGSRNASIIEDAVIKTPP